MDISNIEKITFLERRKSTWYKGEHKMDGVLRAKNSKHYNEIRRKRRIRKLVAVGLCIGAIFIAVNTPIKSRVMARVRLGLTKLEDYITSDESEFPMIREFKLSIVQVDGDKEEIREAYRYVVKRKREIYKGSLQLINGSHAYLFREMDQLVDVKAYKNKSYKLIDTKMKLNKEVVSALNAMMKDFEKATGKHDMIITSGYRTLADQGAVLQEKINVWGEKDALKWAMLPGYSEHHSGYAVDMSIYTDAGEYVKYKGQDEYAWINQNCHKYGLIRRYTADKTEITGVSDEQWHYRYVGVPHAYIITMKQFAFEEYMDYLKQFTFDNRHLEVVCDAGAYEIYFVPSEGKETSVPVPRGKSYTLSGNNEDGFIVTVAL